MNVCPTLIAGGITGIFLYFGSSQQADDVRKDSASCTNSFLVTPLNEEASSTNALSLISSNIAYTPISVNQSLLSTADARQGNEGIEGKDFRYESSLNNEDQIDDDLPNFGSGGNRD